MPSGPPDLHQYWCDKDPVHGMGDVEAQRYLKGRGWKLTHNWFWIAPTLYYVIGAEENRAINYLCWEWDFGGVIEAEENRNGLV